MGFDPEFKLKLGHLYTGWFRWLLQKGRGDRQGRKKNAPTKKNLAWAAEDPKLPLSVDAYKAIAKWMLDYGTHEYIVGHCFLVLTWNLACRSQNTSNIRLGDINWNTSFDAYTIKFAHSKTDQTGEDSKYARLLFANPNLPAVCPVLSLALHLTCNFNKVALDSSTHLFPGDFQNDRFSKILERCLEDHKVQLKNEFGYDPCDIGTHSIRKGAATFITSLPGGPSAAASCICGGWTMGSIKDRYFRYSEAGDQFVGRCLALLNLLTVEFSCSPPMFIVENNSQLDKSIDKLVRTQYQFAVHVDGFLLLCRMCTASFLYHRSWIVASFPQSIIIECAHIYKQANVKTFFKNNPNVLKILFPWNDTHGHSYSGIPPHSALLNDLKALRVGQESMISSFSVEIKRALDESMVVGNSAGMTEKKLLECFDSLKVDILDQLASLERRHNVGEIIGNNNDDNVLVDITEQVERHRAFDVHTFSGRMRRVPETWRFPKGGLFHVWRDWWIGNDVTHVAPLRLLCTKDVDFLDDVPLTAEEMVGRRGGSTTRRPAGKSLSDLRYVMNVLVMMVEEEGTMNLNITIATVDEMFRSIEHRLLVRIRDLQKNWRSVVREFREMKIKVSNFK